MAVLKEILSLTIRAIGACGVVTGILTLCILGGG